jgi:hypothetical protein
MSAPDLAEVVARVRERAEFADRNDRPFVHVGRKDARALCDAAAEAERLRGELETAQAALAQLQPRAAALEVGLALLRQERDEARVALAARITERDAAEEQSSEWVDLYEAARTENAALRAALAPFAALGKLVDNYHGPFFGDSAVLTDLGAELDMLKMGHLRAARAALGAGREGT